MYLGFIAGWIKHPVNVPDICKLGGGKITFYVNSFKGRWKRIKHLLTVIVQDVMSLR